VLLAPRPTPKLDDPLFSAFRDCLFDIFAATLRNQRTSLPPQLEDAPCRGDKGPTQHGSLNDKSKFVPVLSFFNWAPRHEDVLGSGGIASRPSRFTPRERTPGTPWIGGWAGSRAVLYAVVKKKIPAPIGNRTLEPRSSSHSLVAVPTERNYPIQNYKEREQIKAFLYELKRTRWKLSQKIANINHVNFP
jgi:hypothetical protein